MTLPSSKNIVFAVIDSRRKPRGSVVKALKSCGVEEMMFTSRMFPVAVVLTGLKTPTARTSSVSKTPIALNFLTSSGLNPSPFFDWCNLSNSMKQS